MGAWHTAEHVRVRDVFTRKTKPRGSPGARSGGRQAAGCCTCRSGKRITPEPLHSGHLVRRIPCAVSSRTHPGERGHIGHRRSLEPCVSVKCPSLVFIADPRVQLESPFQLRLNYRSRLATANQGEGSFPCIQVRRAQHMDGA